MKLTHILTLWLALASCISLALATYLYSGNLASGTPNSDKSTIDEVPLLDCRNAGGYLAKLCKSLRSYHVRSSRASRAPLDIKGESYYTSELKTLLPALADLETSDSEIKSTVDGLKEEMVLNGFGRSDAMGRWQPMRGKRTQEDTY